MKFGEKLKQHRKERTLTQSQLAEAAGTSLKTIINYESGKTYPQNREMYAKLAEILGVDANYLHNEHDPFVEEARARYGARGKEQAQELVAEVTGLFAGGTLSEQDMDAVMQALQQAYWDSKARNTKKYARK